MSEKLDKLFTHIEVLKSREPIKIDTDEMMESDMFEDVKPIKGNNYAALIESYSQKHYKKSPIFTGSMYYSPQKINVHQCICMVGNLKGVASHYVKQNAKHLASKELLLKIVADGHFKEFHGNSIEEATDYLNNLMPHLKPYVKEDEKEIQKTELSQELLKQPPKTEVRENYVTLSSLKCAEFGAEPGYLFSEAANKEFICTATVPELHLEIKEQAKTKKQAKCLAAKELNRILDAGDYKFERKYDELAPKPTLNDDSNKTKKSLLKQENKNLEQMPDDGFANNGFPKTNNLPKTTDGDVNAKNSSDSTIKSNQNSESKRRLIYEKIKKILKNDDKTGVKEQFNEILDENDHFINKTIKKATLKYSIAESNLPEDFVQAYLEIQQIMTRRKIVKTRTFCGEGSNEKEASDDAAWNAIHFLRSCAFKKEIVI